MKLANVKALSVFAHVGLEILLAHVKQKQQQEQEKGSRKTTAATVWKQSQFLFVSQFALSGFFICKDARNQVVETYHDKARTRGQVRE
jgi:hypothetical protein